MLHRLKRHPIPIQAHFDVSLVLTYALPAQVLKPLVPQGLTLDQFGDCGFLAIAMVQTRGLRPVGLPRWIGKDFFLAGYRMFVRHRGRDGITRRGLRILRSDTDRASMQFFGNLLTHYNYHQVQAQVREDAGSLEISVISPRGDADLHIIADPSSTVGDDALPAGSPFHSLSEARRFAGPLPYTFDVESQTNSIVRIKGVRDAWDPEPIHVRVLKNTFLEQPPFNRARPVLANAFHLRNIEYRWERGVCEPLPPETPKQLDEGSQPCSA